MAIGVGFLFFFLFFLGVGFENEDFKTIDGIFIYKCDNVCNVFFLKTIA